jgi:hypothetical protein
MCSVSTPVHRSRGSAMACSCAQVLIALEEIVPVLPLTSIEGNIQVQEFKNIM